VTDIVLAFKLRKRKRKVFSNYLIDTESLIIRTFLQFCLSNINQLSFWLRKRYHQIPNVLSCFTHCLSWHFKYQLRTSSVCPILILYLGFMCLSYYDQVYWSAYQLLISLGLCWLLHTMCPFLCKLSYRWFKHSNVLIIQQILETSFVKRVKSCPSCSVNSILKY